MNRLNYFNPYQNRPDDHEDQLTRAFLVLMRYSFPVLSSFYDQCRHHYESNRNLFNPHLPPFADLITDDWQIETQRSNPDIQTNYLLSVLITNATRPQRANVAPSERDARYDGILTFGSQLTIIIENKPRASNVWSDQLNPASENLASDTQVLPVPVELEWGSIVKWLTNLLTVPTLAGAERLMIDDFLTFVSDQFAYLNPYDRFDRCKDNQELINRRIETILIAIAPNPETVKYHRGWGHYIETPNNYKAIRKIGLKQQRSKDGKWIIDLCLFAGDTVNQARALYRQPLHLDQLGENWRLETNYHVSFQASNLVWFTSPDEQEYVAYWQAHPDQIRQLTKGEVTSYIADLERQGILHNDETTQTNLERKFTLTKMTTLNSCPGIGLFYRLDDTMAETLDRTNRLEEHLKQKITEGLAMLGLPDFINKQVALNA